AWRADPHVPLVVAEVNPHALANIPKGIVANPNCTTMAFMPVLKPLHAAAGLKRLILSTYQAASGAGVVGVRELERQVHAAAGGSAPLSGGGGAALFPAPQKRGVSVGLNVGPANLQIVEGGYNGGEMKLPQER